MKLSEFSIEALNPFITGDGTPAPRMSGPELIKFFNFFGVRDVYSFENGGLPNGVSRREYVTITLNTLNGKPNFKTLIEGLVDTRRTQNSDELAQLINEIIKHDAYKLEKNINGVYKISGAEPEEKIDIQAYFQEIRIQIIESIQSARLSVWVAMAWFTDKELANELLKKHWDGLNIQVIVNDDDISQKYGLDFSLKGIEFYKGNPSSEFGKKIMHNKFCVIDFKKVIHGSYNWTNNAKYNNESITITESKELAEEFAEQFIKLKVSIRKSNHLAKIL
ncbi:phospholipase D-like domain-containing protein [Acinetobacter pittii]|uniref:phospholipase D-like domain-containing protein n=1 Tax=Acinetobacter pittii TaxID=48296 RepID=UPI003AA94BA8